MIDYSKDTLEEDIFTKGPFLPRNLEGDKDLGSTRVPFSS
jgi:hypothetical protein